MAPYVTWIPALILGLLICGGPCSAEYPFPEAPATISWLPHGYGQTMHVVNTQVSRMKGLHGFRSSPEHIGSWSQPLWGWDVNGYYRGPQVAEVDPGMFQLPLGLIYPENNVRLGLPPAVPAPGKRARRH